MSRELVIVWAGRHRRGEWDRLCGRYRRRIARFARLSEIPVRARGGGSERERLIAEGEALLAAIPEGVWAVGLDRRGTMKSSKEFASWLQRLMIDWPRPIAFLLGSDLGLSNKVQKSARERLSLGPLTLPHELARLLLYEQLYRAFCISAGIKYHRQPL